jgi:hypothetical protein
MLQRRHSIAGTPSVGFAISGAKKKKAMAKVG